MSQRELYRVQYAQASDKTDFLMSKSNLPGPRSNLELIDAFADICTEAEVLTCLSFDDQKAPGNTPGEFVAACGAAGLGQSILAGHHSYYDKMREVANDSRWRVREGIVFAIQRIGQKQFLSLFHKVSPWKQGSLLEQRTLVAGLCEPCLLKDKKHADMVLDLLSEILQGLTQIADRKSEPFRVLKKGLGYALSVAMVAHPEKGKRLFEALLEHEDRDIRWILKENLKKKRLMKMDPVWTEKQQKLLSSF